uniref:hypothetical protein n=1 Tax=Hydrocytium acuminatum TaxID=1745963 RepID=UPI002A8260A4|nr:hypothetical protein UYM18_pgp095 [Hydrocytium acuminatum]WOR09524.1 hypothetical protein [Hydrocytium acuminatum]
MKKKYILFQFQNKKMNFLKKHGNWRYLVVVFSFIALVLNYIYNFNNQAINENYKKIAKQNDLVNIQKTEPTLSIKPMGEIGQPVKFLYKVYVIVRTCVEFALIIAASYGFTFGIPRPTISWVRPRIYETVRVVVQIVKCDPILRSYDYTFKQWLIIRADVREYARRVLAILFATVQAFHLSSQNLDVILERFVRVPLNEWQSSQLTILDQERETVEELYSTFLENQVERDVQNVFRGGRDAFNRFLLKWMIALNISID